jgi:tetratricopeptide (TPR) repeat protein
MILDKMKPQLSEISKAQRMRYNLLYAKAMNKGYVDFTSDSIMKDVTAYYDHHGSDNDKLMAHYLLGCVYRDMGDAPSAINCFNDATEYAGKDKNSYLMLCCIHGQIADLLSGQTLVKENLRELGLAAHYAWLAGDTIDAITAYNQKAFAYEVIGKTELAAKIHSTAMQMFTKWGYKQQAAGISADCMDYLLQRHEFAKAKKLFDLYERESGYFSHGQVARGKEVYYYIKGKYYLAVNQYDSAQYLFRKCMDYMDDPNTKVAAYHGLSMLYNKMQIPDSTAKYAMLAYDANDSSFQYNTAATLMRIQSLYNYSKHQEEARKSAEQTVVLQAWIFGLCAVLILIIYFSMAVYKRNRRRGQRKLDEIRVLYEKEKEQLLTELDSMNELLREKNALIERKDDLLEHEKEVFNSEIEDKKQSIAALKESMAKYERELHIKDYAAMENEIQGAAIKAEFECFTHDTKRHPSNKLWMSLNDFTKDKLPKLFMMLNNNKVTEQEFRICILTRLKFKPGEIATILNCRFSDVTLSRSRLLRKIYGVNDGKAVDFDRRIMLIY